MGMVLIDARRNPATVYENVDVALARQYRNEAQAAAQGATDALIGFRVPRIAQNYGERNNIPMDQRYGGMMVWVESDQRWSTLSADNLGAVGSDAGWKVPSWMVPLQQGTIAQRNNRVGTDPASPTYPGWPFKNMRFLQTDVFPNVLWELRLAGDRAGITADSPVLTSPAWVTVPQAADLIDLKISGFAVEALSSDANPMVRASWTIDGPEPTSQVLAWGSSRVALAGGIREYTSKDWAAIKDIAVSGNSLSDATDSPKYHTIMAARRGVTSRSTARYSRDVTQTYRAGIDQLYFAFAGNSLPAGGTAKAVTSINGNSPIDTSQGYAFLNTGDAGLTTGNTMTGTLVDGGVTRHVTVSIPNGASAAYSVAQDAGLAAITFSGPVLFIPDIAKYFARSDNICGVGQNIFYSGVPNAYGDYTNPGVFVIVDKFAAAADGNRFLFLDILPDANWPADGTPNVIDGVTYTWQCFSAMEATNARNEARHPGARARSLPTSGFPNGRTLLKYLQDHGDGSTNDNADIAAGLVPRSLRSDSLHLNLAGQTVTADFFEEAFQAQVLPAPVTADTVFTLTVSGVFENRGDFTTYQTALSDVATASVRAGGESFDATARDGLSDLQDEVDQMVIAPSYTDRSVASLSSGQAAGTSSVIAANAIRRNVKIVPPADCTVRLAPGGAGGIPIFAGVANDIPLANALFVTGLAAGAALTILEA